MSDYDSIPYGLFEDDNHNARHSIDKLIIDYFLKSNVCTDDFIRKFKQVSGFKYQSDKEEEGYNSFFNKNPSSYYSWFKSSFWFEHCNVKLGVYYRNLIDKVWDIREIIRVEFNPNKCMESDLFVCLQIVLHDLCKSASLYECDYTVDLPCKTENIICQTRKDKVIYNDCRYYGKRHTNGRIKIYNKSRELLDKQKIKLESEITRCEITFKYGQEVQFNQIYLSSYISKDVKLSSNLRTIADLINLAATYGEDKHELLQRFVKDKRNRDQLIPAVVGEFKNTIFNFAIFYRLITKYAKMYMFNYEFDGILGQKFLFRESDIT